MPSANDALISTVQAALSQVWDTQGRRFLSLEWEGLSGGECWLQFLDGSLNLNWDGPKDLSEVLSRARLRLPQRAFIQSERAGGAIVAVGDVLLDELAQWITRFLREVADLPAPELPDVRILDDR